MKTQSSNILLTLLILALISASAMAAPQVTRKRVERQRVDHRRSRHPSPYGQRQQKGMRHYVAEGGSTYVVVNGQAVAAPSRVIYTTPTPVYVGPTIVTTTYSQPGQIYYPTYWNYYAPPPPNPRPAVLYTPCVRPGININLSF